MYIFIHIVLQVIYYIVPPSKGRQIQFIKMFFFKNIVIYLISFKYNLY